MNKMFVPFLPPWAETGLQPAFYDVESGTVLQQTARMYDKVNQLTRLFNELSEETQTTVNHYIEEFTTLYNYVHDYFDNLDVQEEINNKLDAMADDGTLEALIAEYLGAGVQIIFCKQKGNVQSGDATLIKVGEKNVLIDTHLATLKTDIESFLDRNDASHIDYLILSHYHADHIGNVINLITDGYVDSDTTVYLPGYTTLISASTALTENYLAITGAVTTAGCTIVQPTESTTLVIDDATFKFYNCTQDIFDSVEHYTSYNDCSTVVELNYGDRKALFTADIEVKPFERFERLNQFPYKIDFYTIEHHGINYQAKVLPFISRITPDFAVQSAELGDFIGGAIGQGATPIFLKEKNCKLYSTYNNSEDIIFNFNKEYITCKQGIENYSTSNRRPNIPIYVDINTTSNFRDGSESQPFKDLQEALSRIAQNEHTAFTIHLADGTYETNSNSAVLGKISGSTQITIDGNHDHPENTVIANSCQIYNGAFVKYQYVKFTKQIAYVENSVLEVNHCIGVRSEANNTPYIDGGGNCSIRILNSEFTGNGTGQMVSGHGDNLYIRNNTFTDFNICIQNQYASDTTTLSNTYTNVNTKKYLYNGALDRSQKQVLGNMLLTTEASGYNTIDEPIELADDVTKYNMLIFYIGRQGNSTTPVLCDLNGQNIRTDTQDENVYHFVNYVNQGNNSVQRLKVEFTDGTHMVIKEMTNTGLELRSIMGLAFPIAINA